MIQNLKGARPGLTVLLALFVIATVHADQKDKPAIEPDPAVQELTAKQDSVFSVINTQYQSIKPIFEYRCFDCHSRSTKYPWYHKIPVIKGFIDDDIAEGLEHLDLSNDFPFGGPDNILKLLGNIRKEIEEDEMPPLGYRMFHWGRLIEGEKRDSVFQWIDNATATLSEFYGEYGDR